EEIFAVCQRLLSLPNTRSYEFSSTATPEIDNNVSLEAGKPLAGRRVVVTAGGTREPLDPVRYLGNRSSGKQGYALAHVAAARGAEVTLVTANPSLVPPIGVDVVEVQTALELRDAVVKAAVDADVVVMAGAVADLLPPRSAPAQS